MFSCPKFLKCSAPICPLDEEWHLRKHLLGDPICPYLSEYSKPGAEERLQLAIGGEMLETIRTTYEAIYNTYGIVARRLDRASCTPSRLGGAYHE